MFIYFSTMLLAFITAVNFALFVNTGFAGAIIGGCFVFTLLFFMINLVNFFKYGDK